MDIEVPRLHQYAVEHAQVKGAAFVPMAWFHWLNHAEMFLATIESAIGNESGWHGVFRITQISYEKRVECIGKVVEA